MRRFMDRQLLVTLVAATVLAMSGLAGSTGMALADKGNDDKAEDDRGRQDGGGFGAWIYEGSCDALAPDPQQGIGELEQESDADDIARLQLQAPVPSPIWLEDEDVSMTTADLISTPHAMVVRVAADATTDAVACGDVGRGGAGAFSITLHTVGDSGYMGSVRFVPETDDGGPELDVIVGLWEGTSVATPAA